MAKRQVLALIATFGLCVLFFAINDYLSAERPTSKKIILNQKEAIIDETQFVFKPILEQSGEFRRLKILCEITSYMNPEILNLNFKNQTVIEINDEFMLPTSWRVIDQTNDKIIGQLIFNIESGVTLNTFALRIFTFSDHEIIWD